MPLNQRKKILEKTIVPNETLELCFYTDQGQKLWQEVKKKKLEGVIAKIKNSPYEPGKRSSAWLKIKFLKTADTLIIGYTQGKRVISALCLAVYKNKKLFYLGRVGTGFTESFLKNLIKKLKKIKKSPIINPPKKENIIWTKPELIAEVEYLQFTKDQRLRAPVFKRLRFDKPLKECTIEQFD